VFLNPVLRGMYGSINAGLRLFNLQAAIIRRLISSLLPLTGLTTLL
jgi:hypothetical protein